MLPFHCLFRSARAYSVYPGKLNLIVNGNNSVIIVSMRFKLLFGGPLPNYKRNTESEAPMAV